jgi:hypothetical protein
MIISSALFDLILFGGLLIAAGIDAAMPGWAGAATLLAVAAALYVASTELSHRLGQNKQWTQEALSSGLALSALFFIYWWWANHSDLALLTLSIVLMMTALMLTIAIISCVNAMWNQKSAAPLAGFLMTAIGGIVLGALAGPLTLGFGVMYKVIAIVIGGVIWKARERLSPAQEEEVKVESDEAGERWVLLPKGGRSLDRLVPVLVFGVFLMIAAHQLGQSSPLPETRSWAAPAVNNVAP